MVVPVDGGGGQAGVTEGLITAIRVEHRDRPPHGIITGCGVRDASPIGCVVGATCSGDRAR